MSQPLSSNLNYSNIVDASVSSGALLDGVNDLSIGNALAASAPVFSDAWAATVTVALTKEQLLNGLVHQIAVNPSGATTGDLNLTRSAADIVADFKFTQVNDVAIIKIVNFGTADASQNVQFNGTDVLIGSDTIPQRAAFVLLTATNVSSGTEAVSVTVAATSPDA